MREGSPRWEQINPSAYPHEQGGLRELASYLPDAEPYHVWANVGGPSDPVALRGLRDQASGHE